MKTKKRADILVRKLECSKPGRWFDFIARPSEASERLEAAEAVSPAEAAVIIRELMHK